MSHRSGKVDRRIIGGAAALVILLIIVALIFRKEGNIVSPDGTAAKPVATSTKASDSGKEAGESRKIASTTPPKTRKPKGNGEGTDATATLVTLSGRIYDKKTQAAIVGARVSVKRFFLFPAREGEPAIYAETITDAEGKYELPVPRSVRAREFRSGQLVAEAKGYATTNRSLRTAFGEGAALENLKLDMALGPGGSISGKVIDGESRGIAGAVLQVAGNLFETDNEIGGPYASGVAAADGTFTLDGVPARAPFQIMAKADGYAWGVSDSVVAGTTPVTIRLEAATGVIFGKVLDHQDRPVSDRLILAMAGNSDFAQNEARMVSGFRVDTSRPDGSFRLESVPAGNWRVTDFTREDFTGEGELVTLKDGEQREIVLRIPKPTYIVGRAVDATTGTGIGGITLSTSRVPAGKRPSDGVVTSGDGSFKLEVQTREVRRGRETVADVFASAPAPWLPKSYNWSGAAPSDDGVDRTSFTVREMKKGEEKTNLTLAFAQGKLLKGRVVLADQTPVVGAQISMVDEEGKVSSNADGRFSLVLVEAGDVTVIADHRDGRASAPVTADAIEKGEEVLLTLEPYASIAGTLLDEEGNAVAGSQVRVMESDEESAEVGDDGSFAFSRVAAGEVTLRGEGPPGGDYLRSEQSVFTLKPGEAKTGVALILPQGDVVTGVVLTAADRKPVAGATVQARRAAPAETDAEGKFTLRGLRPGQTTDVTVTSEGFADKTMRNVSMYSGDLTILLDPVVEVEIAVEDGDSGKPVPRFMLSLTPANGGGGGGRGGPGGPGGRGGFGGGGIQERYNVADGVVKVPQEFFGEARVAVRELGDDERETGRVGSTTYVADASATPARVTVKINGGGSIKGRVEMEDGSELPDGVSVSARGGGGGGGWGPRRGGGGGNRVDLKDDGTFEITGLMDGSYTIVANADGLDASAEATLAAGKAEPAEVVIQIQSGGNLFGRIYLPEGKTSNDYEFQLFRRQRGGPGGGARPTPITVAEDGSYRAEGLQPDIYTLAARIPEGPQVASEDVTVETKKDVEKDLHIEDKILLSGTVLINGERSRDRGSLGAVLVEDGTNARTQLRGSGGGDYSATVKAGTYRVRAERLGMEIPDPVVLEGAGEKKLDFDFPAFSVDVVYDVPREDMPEGATIVLHSTSAGNFKLQPVDMPTPTLHLPQIGPGRWVAEVWHDGAVIGESEPTDIGASSDNAIIVEPKAATKAKWILITNLPSGTFQYAFQAPNGVSYPDGKNPRQTARGGGSVSYFSIPDEPMADGTTAPSPLVHDGEVTFIATFDASVEEVYVVGSFSQWQRRGQYKMRRVEDAKD